MKPYIFFKSLNSENQYFYSFGKSELSLIHPLLLYIVRNSKKIEYLINSDKVISIENYGKVYPQELKYYYERYKIMKDNNYFNNEEKINQINRGIDAKMVKESITNTNQILFETTDQCNLKCEYCSYRDIYDNYDKRMLGEINISNAKVLLTYMNNLWNSRNFMSYSKIISIGFYGGEPLMNFDFISSIVNFSKKLETSVYSFSYNITTNGTLLEKHLDYLVSNNFRILISLDGDKQDNQYRKFKNNKACFSKVLENILLMKSKYPDYFHKKVSFNSVIHNKSDIKSIYNFFKSTFNKLPFLSELSLIGLNKNQLSKFKKIYSTVVGKFESDKIEQKIKEEFFVFNPYIKSIIDFYYQYSGNVFKDFNKIENYYNTNNFLPTGTCIPFSKKIYLTVNGKILPCERIGHKYYLGIIEGRKVKLDFRKIADFYNQIYNSYKKICKECYNARNCKVCIFENKETKNIIRCKNIINELMINRIFEKQISYIEKHRDIHNKIHKNVKVS